MTIETATDPKDDFEGAFASFATPGADVDKTAEPAAAATSGDGTDTGAATGETDGSGDAAAAAGGGDSGATGDAGAGDGGAGADKGAAAPAAAAEGEKTPAAGDKGAQAGEGGAAPAADAGAAPAAAASDDKSAQEILDRLSKLVAEAPKTEEKVEERKPDEQPTYSEDETKRLTEYDKDWKEVSECEALRRRGEYKELLGFVFGEVQKALAPLQQTVEALAGRTHLADVKAAVGDYSDNLRQQVIDWVGKQPAYLQGAYNHVIENGTADEVKDLVDRYRLATGQAAPAAGAAPTDGQGGKPAKDNELSDAAKEAAAALAPVESKRSEAQVPGDPSSFEDAWSQFAKDLA